MRWTFQVRDVGLPCCQVLHPPRKLETWPSVEKIPPLKVRQSNSLLNIGALIIRVGCWGVIIV